MNIKIAAFDLDATLLRNDKTISAYTARVFEHLRAKGVLIAFATARSEYASQRFIDRVKPDILVVDGGAVVKMGDKTLFSAPFAGGAANAVVAACMGNKSIRQIFVYAADRVFGSEALDDSWGEWTDISRSARIDFCKPANYGDVYKILVVADDLSDVQKIASQHAGLDALRFSNEDWYQIKRCDVSKSNALRIAAERLGLSLSDVAAFGDDANDVEMLRECGVGVAVANAIDEAKAAAGYVCASNEEDGVAKWLEENI